MIIVDDIAYAGNQEPLLKVVGIRPMDDYSLWVRFSNSAERVCSIKPFLEFPAFASLKDPEVFKSVYLDYGVPTWCDGSIDIAPESLYSESA